MDILVFQHLDCEHPGSLRGMAAQAGVRLHTVALNEGDPIPELADFDALWVMGGPMDVWDVRDHPWLIPEKRAIRHWIKHIGKPYLGLCLGHQLLADALNGTCGPQKPADVGITEIELTAAGRQDRLMRGIPDRFNALQWHGVQVAQPPEGAVVLASSAKCPVEAMRIGENAWSMQFHVEVEADTVTNWNAVPAYHAALIDTLGQSGIDRFRRETDANMAGFLKNAETVFNNFLDATR